MRTGANENRSSAFGGLYPPGIEEELGIYFKQSYDRIQCDPQQIAVAAVRQGYRRFK